MPPPHRGRTARCCKRQRLPRRSCSTATALSVSAERGYLRETGNLVFHTALVGVLIDGRHRRRLRLHRPEVLVEGQTVRQRARRLRLVQPRPLLQRRGLDALPADARRLRRRVRDRRTTTRTGRPIDYTRECHRLPARRRGAGPATIKVNEPLRSAAPTSTCSATATRRRITVRDADGNVVVHRLRAVPAAGRATSPRSASSRCRTACRSSSAWSASSTRPAAELSTGAFTSIYPDLADPVLTLRVYTGRPRARRRQAEVRVRARHRRT